MGWGGQQVCILWLALERIAAAIGKPAVDSRKLWLTMMRSGRSSDWFQRLRICARPKRGIGRPSTLVSEWSVAVASLFVANLAETCRRGQVIRTGNRLASWIPSRRL